MLVLGNPSFISFVTLFNKMNMKKVNTKTIRVKEYRDFSKGGTPQERHMENVERGYVTTDYMTRLSSAVVKYEEIDGKRYKVVTF